MQTRNSNTVYAELLCPFCKAKIISGIGFRVGSLSSRSYRIGDELYWENSEQHPRQRPAQRPNCGDIVSIGYFNCDNVSCSTWQDCYPQVQQAFVRISKNIIASVEPVLDETEFQSFEIIEFR